MLYWHASSVPLALRDTCVCGMVVSVVANVVAGRECLHVAVVVSASTPVHLIICQLTHTVATLQLVHQTTSTLDGRLHDDTSGIVDALGAELQHSAVALLLGPCDALIDLLLPLCEPRMHELAVQHRRPAGGGGQKPQHQQDLQLIVEGEPEGHEQVCDGLEAGEESEHDPVHHPFYIFFDVFSLDSFIGVVGGEEGAEHQYDAPGKKG